MAKANTRLIVKASGTFAGESRGERWGGRLWAHLSRHAPALRFRLVLSEGVKVPRIKVILTALVVTFVAVSVIARIPAARKFMLNE